MKRFYLKIKMPLAEFTKYYVITSDLINVGVKLLELTPMILDYYNE